MPIISALCNCKISILDTKEGKIFASKGKAFAFLFPSWEKNGRWLDLGTGTGSMRLCLVFIWVHEVFRVLAADDHRSSALNLRCSPMDSQTFLSRPYILTFAISVPYSF